MKESALVVQHAVEVPVDPGTAFDLFTNRINQWWKRGSHYWNDGKRASGLRFEPFVGGRFIEVYDEQSGDGFEIGRVLVWEPGRRLVYTWREAGWAPGEQTEVEVLFEAARGGTRVSVAHRGWEKVARGAELGGNYRGGYAELLDWYAQAAA